MNNLFKSWKNTGMFSFLEWHERESIVDGYFQTGKTFKVHKELTQLYKWICKSVHNLSLKKHIYCVRYLIRWFQCSINQLPFNIIPESCLINLWHCNPIHSIRIPRPILNDKTQELCHIKTLCQCQVKVDK